MTKPRSVGGGEVGSGRRCRSGHLQQRLGTMTSWRRSPYGGAWVLWGQCVLRIRLSWRRFRWLTAQGLEHDGGGATSSSARRSGISDQQQGGVRSELTVDAISSGGGSGGPDSSKAVLNGPDLHNSDWMMATTRFRSAVRLSDDFSSFDEDSGSIYEEV